MSLTTSSPHVSKAATHTSPSVTGARSGGDSGIGHVRVGGGAVSGNNLVLPTQLVEKHNAPKDTPRKVGRPKNSLKNLEGHAAPMGPKGMAM